MVSGMACISFVADGKGNIGFQKSWAAGGGTPSLTILGRSTGVYFAPNIYALEGLGVNTGPTIGAGPIGVGGEYLMAYDLDSGKLYHGGAINTGFGLDMPIEFHAEAGNTSTIWSVNIVDILESIYDSLLEW